MRTNIYKPVGDCAISYLDDLARNPTGDPYNRPPGDFMEAGKWKSLLYAAIRFFDIMVEEALYQGVEWHMWLYYMPLIVKAIVRNYRIVDPLTDVNSEFPIRYSFLLYEIFSALRYWAESVEDVPLGQPNVVLANTRADHENGNIPKSSILALCECLRFVLESDNLSDQFKSYLANMVFALYFEFSENENLEGFATVVINSLLKGGTYAPRNDVKYRDALLSAFEREQSEYFIKFSAGSVEQLKQALAGV